MTFPFLKYALLAAGIWILLSACSDASVEEQAAASPVINEDFSGTLSIDPEKSFIYWQGRKIASGHNGSLKLKVGTLRVVRGIPNGGSFEMDMMSVKIYSIKDRRKNVELLEHLMSEDFFHSMQYPLARFEISEVTQLFDNPRANIEVSGILTIKGISKPLRFPALTGIQGEEFFVKGELSFDRTDYDIHYRSGKFFPELGDKAILDDILLTLDLHGAPLREQ